MFVAQQGCIFGYVYQRTPIGSCRKSNPLHGYRGHKANGSGTNRNVNEAIAGTALEALTRWLRYPKLEYLAVYMVAPLWDLSTIQNLCSRKVGQSSPKFSRCYILHKTPNHAKSCGDRLKNAGDICDRKIVLQE